MLSTRKGVPCLRSWQRSLAAELNGGVATPTTSPNQPTLCGWPRRPLAPHPHPRTRRTSGRLRSSAVELLLPKLRARVPFPSSAPTSSQVSVVFLACRSIRAPPPGTFEQHDEETGSGSVWLLALREGSPFTTPTPTPSTGFCPPHADLAGARADCRRHARDRARCRTPGGRRLGRRFGPDPSPCGRARDRAQLVRQL